MATLLRSGPLPTLQSVLEAAPPQMRHRVNPHRARGVKHGTACLRGQLTTSGQHIDGPHRRLAAGVHAVKTDLPRAVALPHQPFAQRARQFLSSLDAPFLAVPPDDIGRNEPTLLARDAVMADDEPAA